MVALILTALVIIIGSAICSGSEAALFSVSDLKVRQLVEEKRPAARVLAGIRENMSRPIAAVVILNNMFNIVGSIVVGGMAADVLDSTLLGIFSGLLTLAVIIFSEIIPKTLGERYSDQIALAVAPAIAGVTRLIFPLIWVIEHIVSPITRGRPGGPSTNESEIKLLAQIGQKEGSIEGDESLLIERAFRLNDENAGSLMTPRVSLTFLHGDMTLAEAQQQIIDSPHSRILIIGESIDDVVGVALKSELLTQIIAGQSHQTLANLAKDVRFVPESVRADRLLVMFRVTRRHLAVVLDEFGGTAGVVTLEDVLEVLTGEIVDETDLVVDMQEWARQRHQQLLAQEAKKNDEYETED